MPEQDFNWDRRLECVRQSDGGVGKVEHVTPPFGKSGNRIAILLFPGTELSFSTVFNSSGHSPKFRIREFRGTAIPEGVELWGNNGTMSIAGIIRVDGEWAGTISLFGNCIARELVNTTAFSRRLEMVPERWDAACIVAFRDAVRLQRRNRLDAASPAVGSVTGVDVIESRYGLGHYLVVDGRVGAYVRTRDADMRAFNRNSFNSRMNGADARVCSESDAIFPSDYPSWATAENLRLIRDTVRRERGAATVTPWDEVATVRNCYETGDTTDANF